MYAELPVFKYQTFDRETLRFSEHPIIPPPSRRMRYADEDTDEDLKSDYDPVDPSAPDEPHEIIDLDSLLEESKPADTPSESMADNIEVTPAEGMLDPCVVLYILI